MGSLSEDLQAVGITGGEATHIMMRAKKYREEDGYDPDRARKQAIRDALREAEEHANELTLNIDSGGDDLHDQRT